VHKLKQPFKGLPDEENNQINANYIEDLSKSKMEILEIIVIKAVSCGDTPKMILKKKNSLIGM